MQRSGAKNVKSARTGELNAIEGLERIGKITDEMKVKRLLILANQQRYKECRQNA